MPLEDFKRHGLIYRTPAVGWKVDRKKQDGDTEKPVQETTQ